MDYIIYSNILEYIPKKCKHINKIKTNKLYLHINNFIQKNNIKGMLLSLSGGVDSMVLCIILKIITTENINFNFYCCHINYNNRKESKDERNFLVDWCKYNDIQFDIHNIDHIQRGEGNRQKYEDETRNIRYTFYKELLNKYNLNGVILAHHKDDYSENVFNNIMRGSNSITNLGVFKKENLIHGVKVYRPMLEFIKSDIYKLSNDYQIPYFLDTTPEWSCRGKMRKKIFPECKNCYGNIFMNNLYNIGKQSESLNNIIYNFIIEPFIKKIFFGKAGFFIPKKEELKTKVIFEIIMKYITQKMKLSGCKKKNILNAIKNIDKECEINLISNYKTFITKDYIIFLDLSYISKINSYKKILTLEFDLVSNINNIIKDLIDGYLYYKYDKHLKNIVVNKGEKRNKLKKVLITEHINKYVPSMYKIENEKDKLYTEDLYIKISMLDII